MSTNPLRKYLRESSLPPCVCSGCGAAQVLNYFVQAADELDLDFDNLVAIGGVGCAARIPVYLHAESLHGVHGRTLPWATGIKLHKPELDVVISAGDGDAGAIGGNHLIQAARRNLDVTMIVVNNLTFAMTGGQVAPTTFQDVKTATTPYGNVEQPFDLCKLAETAGVRFLGSIPIDPKIVDCGDSGRPFAAEPATSPTAEAFARAIEPILAIDVHIEGHAVSKQTLVAR